MLLSLPGISTTSAESQVRDVLLHTCLRANGGFSQDFRSTLKNFRDSTGALFRGTNRYRLRVPADTPAHDFWSIIAYEVGTNAFIHNPENRVGVSWSDKQQMEVNPDGWSADVYIGPTAPDGLTNNWIPTTGKDFWLIARFYGPDKVLFEKAWAMPDIEKVS